MAMRFEPFEDPVVPSTLVRCNYNDAGEKVLFGCRSLTVTGLNTKYYHRLSCVAKIIARP
jgi:hypothetical protein